MESNTYAIQIDNGPIIEDVLSISESPAVSKSFELLDMDPTLTLQTEPYTSKLGSKTWSHISWSINDLRDGEWLIDKFKTDDALE